MVFFWSGSFEVVLSEEDVAGAFAGVGGVAVGGIGECFGEELVGGLGVAFVDHDAGEVEDGGF